MFSIVIRLTAGDKCADRKAGPVGCMLRQVGQGLWCVLELRQWKRWGWVSCTYDKGTQTPKLAEENVKGALTEVVGGSGECQHLGCVRLLLEKLKETWSAYSDNLQCSCRYAQKVTLDGGKPCEIFKPIVSIQIHKGTYRGF